MICWNVPFQWLSMTRSYPKVPHLLIFGTDETSNLGHKLTVASPNLRMANPSRKGRGQCHATFFSFEASSYLWNMWHYELLTWYTEWTRSKHQKLSPTESWFFFKFWAPILTWTGEAREVKFVVQISHSLVLMMSSRCFCLVVLMWCLCLSVWNATTQRTTRCSASLHMLATMFATGELDHIVID